MNFHTELILCGIAALAHAQLQLVYVACIRLRDETQSCYFTPVAMGPFAADTHPHRMR